MWFWIPIYAESLLNPSSHSHILNLFPAASARRGLRTVPCTSSWWLIWSVYTALSSRIIPLTRPWGLSGTLAVMSDGRQVREPPQWHHSGWQSQNHQFQSGSSHASAWCSLMHSIEEREAQTWMNSAIVGRVELPTLSTSCKVFSVARLYISCTNRAAHRHRVTCQCTNAGGSYRRSIRNRPFRIQVVRLRRTALHGDTSAVSCFPVKFLMYNFHWQLELITVKVRFVPTTNY